MFLQNMPAPCQRVLIKPWLKTAALIPHFTFLWAKLHRVQWVLHASAFSQHRRHQIQALGSKFVSGWAQPLPGKAGLAKRPQFYHPFAHVLEICHSNFSLKNQISVLETTWFVVFLYKNSLQFHFPAKEKKQWKNCLSANMHTKENMGPDLQVA